MQNYENVKIPEQEIRSRIQGFQAQLKRKNLDGALILQNANLFYFTGTVQDGVLFTPQEGAPVYYVKKNLLMAQNESPLKGLVRVKSLKQIPQLLKEHPIHRLGMEFDAVPKSQFDFWSSNLKKTHWENVSSEILGLRAVKSPLEIQALKEAGRIVTSAFKKIPEFFKGGMTELELSTLLVRHMRLMGHCGFIRTRAFRSEVYVGGAVSCGISSAEPWAYNGPVSVFSPYPGGVTLNGRRKIEKDQPVLVDMLGCYNGYIYDFTRTYVWGTLDRTLLKAHDLALSIREEVMKRMVPGALPEELYFLSLRMAEEGGFSQYFMNHGLNQVKFMGHGVGLELDETPVLAKGFKEPLAPGNVIALEPKIIFPDKGGVGVEDTVLVTQNGGQILRPSPSQVISL